MKRHILLFLFLMLSVACQAQRDNMNCARNYSLYKEFMNVGSYDLAVEPYWDLVNECPGFSKSLMRDGITIYRNLMAKTSSAATICSHLDNARKISDKFGRLYGDTLSAIENYLTMVQEQVRAGKIPVSRFYDDTEPLLQDTVITAMGRMVSRLSTGSDSSMAEFRRRFLVSDVCPGTLDSLARLKMLMEIYRLKNYPGYLDILERIYDVSGHYRDGYTAAEWAKSSGKKQKAFSIYSKIIASLKAGASDDPQRYLTIATIYCLNADLVPGDDFNRQCLYWVAADYAALGATADPAAAKMILTMCNERAPKKGEAFMRSILPGSKVSVKGFAPETTVARFPDDATNRQATEAWEDGGR